MFGKIFTAVVVVSSLISGAVSRPTSHFSHGVSFNNWHGISSFNGFDNFYGVDNFVGAISSQTFVEQDRELVCHTQAIEIIQQRLLVLQEMAKRIITEQICEVETQTVVFEQFHSSLGFFSHDLRRTSHFRPGFDAAIVGHFGEFFLSDGSLSTHDFGFTGRDLGHHTVFVGGSNWNDATSPASVSAAFSASRNAFYGSF